MAFNHTYIFCVCLHVFNYLPYKWLHILYYFVIFTLKSQLWLKYTTLNGTFIHQLSLALLLFSFTHCLKLSLFNLFKLFGFKHLFKLFFGQELVFTWAHFSYIRSSFVFFKYALYVDYWEVFHSFPIDNSRFWKATRISKSCPKMSLLLFKFVEFFVSFI